MVLLWSEEFLFEGLSDELKDKLATRDEQEIAVAIKVENRLRERENGRLVESVV